MRPRREAVNVTRLVVSVVFVVIALGTDAAAQVTRAPYLQSGSDTSITIRWRTSTATNSRVRYGASPTTLTSVTDHATVTTEHVVTLSGLAANTTYYYSVGSTTAVQAGGDANHFFVTAPQPGTSKNTRIWVIGDAGTGSSSQTAVRDAYYSYTGTRHTDLWLQLGDNAYSTGTDAEYQSKMFNVYAAMLRKSVTWPTRGNHESATDGSGVVVYYNLFTLPTNGQAGGVASGTEAYYSYDYGNIHFICLDSMGSSRSATGAMANWLRNDLANNTKAWTIAFWHHPPYTKGSHNSDTESQLVEMRTNIVPILEAGGVDLVLSGHSHSYERSRFIDEHYGLSTTFNAASHVVQSGAGQGAGAYTKGATTPSAHSGAVYVVPGSSGQTSGGSLNHPAHWVSLNQLGSLVIDIDGARLDAKFLRETGAVADSFTIIKSAPTEPPPSPTGLSATAGDTQVSLSWSAAAGATSYNVKRATTTGGPYATIATGITTTAYTSTGLANGTTYHYVISALNAVGESGNSNQASATPSEATTTTLIGLGSAWKYLDNGTNQGTAWRAASFSDTSWASGNAELGYGDDQATVLSYGPSSSNKYITTYFRKSFTVTNAASFTALTLRIERDDGAVVYLNGTEVARVGMPSGTISYTTLATAAAAEDVFDTVSIPVSQLVEGTNVIAVELHQSAASSSDISFDLDLVGQRNGGPPPPGPTTFVALDAVWKYRDNGTDQGTAWRALSFDDASWASGAAELGYGDDQTTTVSYGPSSSAKYITTYFRKSFTVSNAASYTGVTMRIERDDGAVVYLNGVEVARVGMPAGTVTYTTPANVNAAENVFDTVSIPASRLVEGTNVIAVEIHQESGTSSDISFKLDLVGAK
jgi:hypothetical protein